MRLPSDEDLILHYYRDSERTDEIDALLDTSDELRRRFESIRAVLDAVEPEPVPERSELYGHAVWRAVRPQIERPLGRESSRWLSFPKAAGWAVAATLLLAISFWAGRESAPPAADVTALSAAARERILLVAVSDHLERSQFLLVELANAPGETVLESDLTAARELTRQNRLFRLAAQNNGESEVEQVLDELERFLTELAHVSTEESTELAGLVERLEQKNLIFKVRVLGARLDERAQPTDTTPTT